MTLEDWTADVIEDLRLAGYTVENHDGFPLATDKPSALGLKRSTALLEFQARYPANRAVYAEGVLFSPAARPAERLGRTTPAEAR